ncbi:MAG: hypothetical protein RRC34_09945 [Lentisphaeria bacterium]|nr:hypothetical protein [Lentisphaeria bacterium]
MAERILFVLEGEKPEKQILRNVENLFFGSQQLKVLFGAEVYQLCRSIEEDPDLDLFELLKGRSDRNYRALEDYTRKDFSQIYLFFDYEGQASAASDDDLDHLLEHFNNETEAGKLFVSYPMVEALKDINRVDDFKDFTVSAFISGKKAYKKLASERTGFPVFKKFSKEDWQFIIKENEKKANLIVGGGYKTPPVLLEQPQILYGQITTCKDPHELIGVLSAFPFFLLDYFGWETLEEKLGSES